MLGQLRVYRQNTKVVTAVRKDWFGQALYDARNSVAHFRGPGSQRIEEKHLNSLNRRADCMAFDKAAADRV